MRLEGAMFALGKATLVTVANLQEVATSVMEDITVLFARETLLIYLPHYPVWIQKVRKV